MKNQYVSIFCDWENKLKSNKEIVLIEKSLSGFYNHSKTKTEKNPHKIVSLFLVIEQTEKRIHSKHTHTHTQITDV